jgi:hypothetical protein
VIFLPTVLLLGCGRGEKEVDDVEPVSATGDSGGQACPDNETHYLSEIDPIVEGQCMACHFPDGLAQGTDLVFEHGATDANFQILTELATVVEEDGYLLWLKATGQHGQGHGGGLVLPEGSEGADALALFIGRANGLADECDTDFVFPGSEDFDCSDASPGARLLRRLSHVEYDNSIRDLFGIEAAWGKSFAPDNVSHGYNNSASGLLVSALLADQYMNAAEDIASEVVHSGLETILPCGLSDRNLNCAEDFLMDHGTRIFRRPLNSSEMDQYLGLFEEIYYEDGFNEAMKWTISALLQSPQFLYRSELGQDEGSGRFALTGWEVAAELSYMIWQTTPDSELLSLAASGGLSEPDAVQAKAEEMLADPKASETVVAMAEQWLSLDLLPIVAKEGEYVELGEELRSDMALEISKFFYSSFSENLPFGAFLGAQHSYMNEGLAAFYGVEMGDGEVDADGFAKIDLSGDHRYGGLLSQGALLTVHALPSTSSPIHRGVLVRERLLCEELAPPPANIDSSPPEMDPDLSTRERYEAHSSDPSCASCHVLIDPIGFGFENFDGIGRWRESDGGQPIDATGTVFGLDSLDQDFEGLADLSVLLSESEQVSQCYVQQWFTFGFGDGDMDEASISCGVEAAATEFRDDGSRLQSPLLGLVGAERFLWRSASAGEGDGLAVASDYIEANPVDTEEPGGENPDVDVYVHEDSNWGSGYCNSVTLTNLGEAQLVWSITLEVPGSINSLWSAEATDLGNGEVEFSGVEWNAELAPGGSASFGYCSQL